MSFEVGDGRALCRKRTGVSGLQALACPSPHPRRNPGARTHPPQPSVAAPSPTRMYFGSVAPAAGPVVEKVSWFTGPLAEASLGPTRRTRTLVRAKQCRGGRIRPGGVTNWRARGFSPALLSGACVLPVGPGWACLQGSCSPGPSPGVRAGRRGPQASSGPRSPASSFLGLLPSSRSSVLCVSCCCCCCC